MCFVDGEQGDLAAIEQRQEALRQQALRRDIEQVEVASQQSAFHLGGGLRVQRRIQEGRAHAQLVQRLDLVLHQGDQWRDDDGRARPQQRRHLVAQRFAATRGHQHQAVAAGEDLIDDGGLFTPEGGVAEDAAKYFLGGCHALRVANRRVRAVRKRREWPYESVGRPR